MSACLISYIVVGPKEFSPGQLAKARELLVQRAQEWRAWGARCETLINIAESDDDFPDPPDWLTDTADSEFGSMESAADGCPFDTDEDVDKFLANFWEMWEDNWPDCNWREMPGDPSKRIWIAGEMSWGDTPEGDAYQMMHKLHLFGQDVLGALGLE
jgi:hypothetical protein